VHERNIALLFLSMGIISAFLSAGIIEILFINYPAKAPLEFVIANIG
jgi:hypothetical protein